eukprot:714475-Alexandrium_andersonii.AAC.1
MLRPDAGGGVSEPQRTKCRCQAWSDHRDTSRLRRGLRLGIMLMNRRRTADASLRLKQIRPAED